MAKFERSRRELKRAVVGVVGSAVLVVGIIAIPYPGPGWAIVFIGLAILATEFQKAQQVLDFARDKYDRWKSWLKKQSHLIQVLFFILTTLFVILTLWLIDAYGFINHALNLNIDWLDSPIL